jgi:hypothetical protein
VEVFDITGAHVLPLVRLRSGLLERALMSTRRGSGTTADPFYAHRQMDFWRTLPHESLAQGAPPSKAPRAHLPRGLMLV